MSRELLLVVIMACVTYLIRALPFVLFRKKIKNRFIRSFLFYTPYAVLSAMTIPAVFSSTGHIISSCVGFVAAFVAAFMGKKLLFVAILAVLAALAAEGVLLLL